MRKLIVFLGVMLVLTISTQAQNPVKDSINGTEIEGIYIGNETTTNEINGVSTDYITDIWYLGQFYNTGRGICVYGRYMYVAADSTLYEYNTNVRTPIALNDTLIGQPVKHWFDSNIDEANARNYAWILYWTYERK